MHVGNIRITETGASEGTVRAIAEVRCDDQPGQVEELWFEVPESIGNDIEVSGDPWLAALLPLAVRIGESIHIDATVDPFFFETRRELMEWWQFWFPEMRPVSIHASIGQREETFNNRRTAQFFSGGVDSFFSLLRHLEPDDPLRVDDLLIGWGFDLPLSDPASFDLVRSSLQNVASQFGRRLIPFATNIRETRFGGIPWGVIGNGNALGAVALLLQDTYDKVIIPSSDGYLEPTVWGSHAFIDHLFESSRMRVFHDGPAYSRFQKVEFTASSPIALETLRVCWKAKSAGNCGRCEKCLRTMIALEICGALEKSASFAHAKLDKGAISRVYCPRTHEDVRQYFEEMRDVAKSRGRSDISRRIGWALRRSQVLLPIDELSYRLRLSPRLRPIGQAIEGVLDRMTIN